LSTPILGKTALVTGSSRGIGKAIVIRLAAAGANVAINYKEHRTEALGVARKIESMGRKVMTFRADVRNEKSVDRMIEMVIGELGRIDILVNNAGIIRDRTMRKMTSDEWTDVIQTNLTGSFYCTRRVVPHLISQKWGRIINIASLMGLTGNFGQTNYSASKAGLIGMTRSLAKELAGYNILVNAIAPGFVKTSMTHSVPKVFLSRIVDRIPLKRLAYPEEIADAVVFLVGSDYITGQVLVIDGGLSLAII
jgi:3-oxoacyl-(acyl-carrier-protein) reductase